MKLCCLVIMEAFAAVIFLEGILQWKQKEPVRFWSEEQAAEENAVKNVEIYNRDSWVAVDDFRRRLHDLPDRQLSDGSSAYRLYGSLRDRGHVCAPSDYRENITAA